MGSINSRFDSQKDAFLNGEGDMWFYRNYCDHDNEKLRLKDDIVLDLIKKRFLNSFEQLDVLEIGCGQGLRLKYLSNHTKWNINAVDPSKKSIETAKTFCNAYQASADSLPFPPHSIDLLIYGFCLYLCDSDDLFQIANEANRVLKDQGWILIHDFCPPYEITNTYKHLDGVLSRKMMYSNIFTWHPSYNLESHSIHSFSDGRYTDLVDDMVGLTLIRKSCTQ